MKQATYTAHNDQTSFDELVMTVFRLNGRLIEVGNDIVRDLSLSSALWQVLGALGIAHVPLTVPMIAERMGLTRQSVQRSVQLLMEKGLVRYEDNPAHKRSRLIVLTERGTRAHQEAGRHQRRWLRESSVAFTREEMMQLTERLRLLTQQIDEKQRKSKKE